MDGTTDTEIQDIIRAEFGDRTIIAIAHRLQTITDFDMIALLDNGRLVEFDSPVNLLRGPTAFSELYNEYRTNTNAG